jgi:hypothetical protein
MREADDEHRETEGARTALVPFVNDPEREPERPEEEGQTEAQAPPASRRMGATPWVVAVGAVILLSTLLLMLADAQRNSDLATTPRPTPTHAPTATVAVTPTPTPLEGFQYYVDRTNIYQIQYPVGWVTDQLNPGIQFSDDANAPGYQVQIVPVSTATAIGPTANPADPSAWVNYALDNLEKRLPQGSYMRVMGSAPIEVEGTPTASASASPTPSPTVGRGTPTPDTTSCALAQLPVNIGGEAWQTGGLLVTGSDPSICVQVYATVYNGKPYIITLSAYNDRFIAGNIEFFTPMLKSFQFLPPNS